jgi:PEP-CTERM putative exosortase interaction domain
MNNLYHKVAVTSVGIALVFALGANKEAKAATIILTPTTSFGVTDQDGDEQGDSYYSGVPLHVGLRTTDESGQKRVEDRAFYEFNIANLSLDSNTVITSAIFQVRVDSLIASHRYYAMQLFGYRGNGQPDASDFSQSMEAGFGVSSPPVSDFETSIYLGWYNPVGYDPVHQVNFNLDFSVTPFVNELISKNNAFAGFSIRDNDYHIGDATLNHMDASLIITTEPVPEPTTIFGSAIGLCLGGWLKRKTSTSQNKAKSQA